jgi:nicotinamide riboside kinase
MNITRIAIMGAESTGKTTLSHALARALPNAVIVPEMLRAWVAQHGRTPQQHEQRGIMQMQMDNEAHITQHCAAGIGAAAHIVLCDTTPLTIALASQYYFNDDSLIADAVAHHRGYAHTLVCVPDIAWVADGLQRDGPVVRTAMATRIDDALAAHGITAIRVHGQGDARAAHALAALQWLLES